MKSVIEIAGDRHLETLGNCGGYYACPKDPDGHRLGPLVAYAGDYDAGGGTKKRFVGDVYANFAKAEPHTNVLKHFARLLAAKLHNTVGLVNIDVFCGAPIGGYSLADALGLMNDIDVIKAEKNTIAVKTATDREISEIVFQRHDVEADQGVIVVEDVCNNFSTTKNLLGNILVKRARVLAIACFLNRSLTVEDVYEPGEILLKSGKPLEGVTGLKVPVISLVRLPINEWKQDDPAVAEDVAKGNVVLKAKDEWDRLMQVMRDHV